MTNKSILNRKSVMHVTLQDDRVLFYLVTDFDTSIFTLSKVEAEELFMNLNKVLDLGG